MRSSKDRFLDVWFLLLGFGVLSIVVLLFWLGAAERLPDIIGRELTIEEEMEVIKRNSNLTEYVYLSGNADFPRNQKIKKITIHHMAEDLALDRLGYAFADRDRKASANYAIDTQGRVALYVEEANRAWTSSSRENDHQAVTIEVANDEIGGDWHVSDEAYDTLIQLCTDICRRNGIKELVWTGDAEGTLTIHKMFSDTTQCPGPYLESKMPEIARLVTENLSKETGS